jgi:RHS repeat-associated protein
LCRIRDALRTFQYFPSLTWNQDVGFSEFVSDALTLYDHATVMPSNFGYASDGRRMSRASGGATTYFGNDPVSPGGYDDTIEDYDSAGTRTATYLHGTRGDELLGYKTASWSSYHTDALGSVTRLTNASGTTSTYRYDAFGGIRSQTGSGNTYGFASRESETGAGLYYNRARSYDPTSGRFLSKDSMGAGYA